MTDINETKPVEKFTKKSKKEFQYSEATKKVVTKICFVVLGGFIVIAGVCKAYEVGMSTYIDQNLRNAVEASFSHLKTGEHIRITCDGAYDLAVKWKTENKIALTNSGNPCPLHQA